MRINVEHRGEVITMSAEPSAGQIRLESPDRGEYLFAARVVDTGLLEIEYADRRFRVALVRNETTISASFGGVVWQFLDSGPLVSGKQPRTQSGQLHAPMTGGIAEVLVAERDSVDAYQPLVILEAMKVLATVEAPFSGTVKRVYVSKGDRVDHGAILIELAPDE